MSAEAIVDAITTKVAGVTGIRRAYGSGATSSAVPTMPNDIPATPVALVIYAGFQIDQPERVTHEVTIRVYVENTDTGAAYRTLVPMVDRMILAWRTDADLGQTCQVSLLTRGAPPTPEEVNGKPYLVMDFTATALEYRPVPYTV